MNGQTIEKTKDGAKKWKEGYRLGSTVFKEVTETNSKGKVRLIAHVCAICGIVLVILDEYRAGELSIGYESHEIMHLLQKILAVQVLGRDDELIFEEDEE